MSNATKLSATEAHALIVEWMRAPHDGNPYQYGYDVYLPYRISKHLGNPPGGAIELFSRANSSILFAAAWELCRRGLLRPGAKDAFAQATSDGQGGNGYSITPLGVAWLAESDPDRFVVAEPTFLAKRFESHRSKFGEGYHERSQEAARCYASNNFIACCAMTGAAAEAILLAVAFVGSEKGKVLESYKASQGRRRIENAFLTRLPDSAKAQARAGLDLLKYWRDDASHGDATGLSEGDAYISLLVLIRFSGFVHDHWSTLTASRFPASN
jgi:hypothetical protein